MTLKETLLLSAAVGFFLIWAGELFKGIPLKESYFWVMFSIICLLWFQYAKNVRLKAEETAKKEEAARRTPAKSVRKKR
jgi:hypothetical protein